MLDWEHPANVRCLRVVVAQHVLLSDVALVTRMGVVSKIVKTTLYNHAPRALLKLSGNILVR